MPCSWCVVAVTLSNCPFEKKIEIGHLPWGMLDREKRWIERKSYFIREKANLLWICEVIGLFHCAVGPMCKLRVLGYHED